MAQAEVSTTQKVPFRGMSISALVLAGFVTLYILPNLIISFYLKIYSPYEPNVGWFMIALMLLGVFIIPPIALTSLILSIISLVKNPKNKVISVVALSLLGFSGLMVIVLLSLLRY